MAHNMTYKFKNYLGIENNNPFTILEAKATETKTTKEVSEKEIAGYDYKDKSNPDNQIFDQYIKGLKFEMEQDLELLEVSPKESLLKAKDIVIKNLKKDPLYYMKNAAFGVKDLGYTEQKPQTEPTGKHKSSGYGDLKENKMSKSTQLKELLEEAVAGIPSIGNPFAERKNQAYEDKFAAFLAEEKEKTNELFGIGKKKQPKTIDDVKNRYNELAKEYAELQNQLKGGGTPTPEWNKKRVAVSNEMLALGKKLGFDADDKGYKALEEGEAAYDEKGKEAGKKMKKKGKKQLKEVVAEIEKVAEMAGNYVKMKEYQRKISELKETYTSISEDENLQEFIDESKTKSLQEEIALYEKYCNEATEAYEYSKNNK
jgi:hypothetical protein